MSVRAASFNDDWRAVFKRDYAECIQVITLENSKTIEDARVPLGKGISALVGGNGVGKSTFAHAIVEGLLNSSGTPDLIVQQDRINGSIINFNIDKSGTQHARRVTFSSGKKIVEGDDTVACTWLDPSLFSTMCRQQVQGDEAFEDVLDGITGRVFSEPQVKLASYVVGKNYSACEVWEVLEYGPFDVWPYFKVKIEDVEYCSETMGQGELAMLTAIWAVQRASSDSLVILEEPETHVSSRSQVAFMDFLAREGKQRGISFLLTTHSPVILQKIPISNVYLLLGSGSRSKVITSPRQHHISSLLGGGVSHKALLIVEDDTAKEFCEAMVENIDPDFSRQISYSVSSDGESEIVKILRTMPRVQGWATLIGCFDGDQRESRGQLVLPWPHVFLPGAEAPDRILQSGFHGFDRDETARELRVDRLDLDVALAAAAGVDFHDWARHVSGGLNIEKSHFIKGITKIWINGNDAAARQFIADVKQAL
ncbi:ATP-binding protein [Pseudomonas sp. BP8]|uniref:ATP-dependent nuclease n=1 Tax=Pseudomonas sp. BP8 TaxID=2817864 RepID=UPI001AEB784C|nr:ATP-binding protein [Pseudomonas sp. BP8]MBP2261256.1 putative ATPase [Pseudomonas sp. BP8]HDS1736248.1 AAA family ATPase [Pseudomonas putida]